MTWKYIGEISNWKSQQKFKEKEGKKIYESKHSISRGERKEAATKGNKKQAEVHRKQKWRNCGGKKTKQETLQGQFVCRRDTTISIEDLPH